MKQAAVNKQTPSNGQTRRAAGSGFPPSAICGAASRRGAAGGFRQKVCLMQRLTSMSQLPSLGAQPLTRHGPSRRWRTQPRVAGRAAKRCAGGANPSVRGTPSRHEGFGAYPALRPPRHVHMSSLHAFRRARCAARSVARPLLQRAAGHAAAALLLSTPPAMPSRGSPSRRCLAFVAWTKYPNCFDHRTAS
jgi:hypothetical protein